MGSRDIIYNLQYPPTPGKGFRYANLCFVLYIIVVVLNLMLPYSITNGFVIGLGTCIFLTQLNYVLKYHKKMLIYLGFFLLVAFVFSFKNGPIMVKALYLLPHIGLLMLLIRNCEIDSRYIRGFLYLWILFVIYEVMVRGNNVNDILGYASRNMVSWFGLILCVFYYILEFRKKSRPEYLTAFLTLFLAILCQGRSSMVCTALFVLFIFYLYLERSNMFLRFAVLVFIPVTIFVIYNTYNSFFLEHFQYLQDKKLESEGRELILEKYMGGMDTESFFSGVSMDKLHTMTLYSNYHNSLLQGHAIFGIFFLFFLVYLIYLLLKYPFKNVPEKFIVIILLIRGLTDPILFVGSFDFLLFYLLYLIYKQKPLLRRDLKI